jgi:hypothetical protein
MDDPGAGAAAEKRRVAGGAPHVAKTRYEAGRDGWHTSGGIHAAGGGRDGARAPTNAGDAAGIVPPPEHGFEREPVDSDGEPAPLPTTSRAVDWGSARPIVQLPHPNYVSTPTAAAVVPPPPVVKFLRECGYAYVPEEPDGNCLFRALARQVAGHPNKENLVRSATVKYLADNPWLVLAYASTTDDPAAILGADCRTLWKARFHDPQVSREPLTVSQYLEVMSRPNTYGSAVEIAAFEDMFGVRVDILTFSELPAQDGGPPSWKVPGGGRPQNSDRVWVAHDWGTVGAVTLLYSMASRHYFSVYPSERPEPCVGVNPTEVAALRKHLFRTGKLFVAE